MEEQRVQREAEIKNLKMIIKKLRVGIARVAQCANVETEGLQVLDKPFEELYSLSDRNRGWHALLAEIVEKISNLKSNQQTLKQIHQGFLNNVLDKG